MLLSTPHVNLGPAIGGTRAMEPNVHQFLVIVPIPAHNVPIPATNIVLFLKLLIPGMILFASAHSSHFQISRTKLRAILSERDNDFRFLKPEIQP